MPTFNFRRIDLDLIEPEFRAKILDVFAACLARGFSYHATRGYDTYGAQMAIWAQGRTKPGKIVTNAKGGQSAHNFGIAIDFVLDKNQVKTESGKTFEYDTLVIATGSLSGTATGVWSVRVVCAVFLKCSMLIQLSGGVNA